MDEVVCPESLDSGFFLAIQNSIAFLEESFNLEISLRGNRVIFHGRKSSENKFKKHLTDLISFYHEKGYLNGHEIKSGVILMQQNKYEQLDRGVPVKYVLKINGKEVIPRSINQRLYLMAMENCELVFGIGPAGTGKTFLAIAMALNYLLNKKVERIVLTRPVVEAGEKLGFLPGDIQQKINPYLRPLYDALYFLIGFERTLELIDKGIIEIAPLAYMRGRTINNAFIILDEGQNCVDSQMKMLLTRFGVGSRLVVTADITQIDLESHVRSGIFKALKILKDIPGIQMIYLTSKDIVRHPLVQLIVDAYDKSEK